MPLLHQLEKYLGKLSEFLKLPPPPSQVCKPKTLPRGRVLTSEENLRALEEKEQKKKEEIEAKEQWCLDKETGKGC